MLSRRLLSIGLYLAISAPICTNAAVDGKSALSSWVAGKGLVTAPSLESPDFDKILAKVKVSGTGRIIVRLKEPKTLGRPFTTEGGLSPEMAESQRQVIDHIQSSLMSRLSSKTLKKTKQYKHIPFLAMEVDEVELEKLVTSPEVDFIEEDIPVPLSLAESIPLIGASADGTFSGFSGAGQSVAILDTGVDSTHPFLAGKVVDEACYSLNLCPNGQTSMTGTGAGRNCDTSINGCFHGTHVAGIAAGEGIGFSGVARDSSIIAVQVFSRFNTQTECGGVSPPCVKSYTSDFVYGLERVFDIRSNHNIAAVNMSLGGGLYNTNCDNTAQSVKAAIDNLRSVGIATIIASGNDGNSSSISYPACVSTAISVGATTKLDTIASYSNSSSLLTLLAPGTSIFSSFPGNQYYYASGTSMATPHVAGAWAVIKSEKPTATVDEIQNALVSTGIFIEDGRNRITKPRINLGSAVTQITPCVYTVSPTSASIVSNGGTNYLSIACGKYCSWIASSNDSWITLTSGTSGIGNGTIIFSVAANRGDSRTGTITVAGYTITVMQQGIPPIANFTATATRATAPFTVNFIDQSQAATSWHWDFGDGTSSNEQNPKHNYATRGNFQVTLDATNASGTSRIIKSVNNFIDITSIINFLLED